MDYISVTEAVGRGGLRLVLSAGAPGPWGEAAKAVFDVKGLPYVPVRQHVGTRDAELFRWTGQYAAPAAMFEDERPRTRWYEIVALAERIAPAPPLLPEREEDRLLAIGLTHEMAAEDGLGWHYRAYYLTLQKAGEEAAGTDYKDQIETLHTRYVDAHDAKHALDRMRAILGGIAAQLAASKARGNRYLVSDRLTVADIYWVTFSNFLRPIATEYCPMSEGYRQMGEWMGDLLAVDLPAALIDHRDRVLLDHFRLPMSF